MNASRMRWETRSKLRYHYALFAGSELSVCIMGSCSVSSRIFKQNPTHFFYQIRT